MPRFFHSTHHHKVNGFTIPSLLKSCASRLDVAHGKRIHATVLHLGLHSDLFIASSLISFYSKCGHLSVACHVFEKMSHRDATLWNSMLAAYFYHHCTHEGLSCLRRMQISGFRPDGHSLTILLAACSDGRLGLNQGEEVHGFIVRNALQNDTFTLTALIHMYSMASKMTRAFNVFDGVLHKSISMWNAVISGFCYDGLWDRSLELFALMMSEGLEVKSETASSILTACSVAGAGGFGRGVHCCAVKMGFELDSYVCTSLITMYANTGSVDAAFRFFDSVPIKKVQLWNSMLSAFVASCFFPEVLDVYNQMRYVGVNPDAITMSNVLSACSMIEQWEFGQKIHGFLIKRQELSNMVVQSSLISMYMKNGDVDNATLLFSSAKEWDVVILSSMITGFCQNKMYDHALHMFNLFRAEGFVPDSVVFASIVSACTALDCIQLGYQIHSLATRNCASSNAFVGSALVNMYSKYGLPLSAERVFSAISKKNLVVWNSLISGYSRNGLLSESISTFAGMTQNGLLPDSVSITSILVSVSAFAALAKGKMIHGYLVRIGILCDDHVVNSLIDMYVKCGCLRYAQVIFRRMPVKNIVALNTMIAGYGSHGHCLKAIDLFDEMKKSKLIPDGTTFLSLISSCSHSGLLDKGCKLFDLMINDYGVTPTMEHYSNMVDLFSRAGCLDEAYSFIKAMPVEPNESIWLCFLSACRSHRASNFGEIASDHLVKLKPGSGSYIQVMNLYGEMGLMEKYASVRFQMKEAGISKNPGCSWIEVMDRVHVFYSGDSSSPLTAEIHYSLKSLWRIMKLVDEFYFHPTVVG